MDVLRERSAGLDVHRSVIVACVLTSSAGAPVSKAVQSFAATAAGLVGLVSWLRGFAVTPVGMEGTGVYWMPVYAALEAAGGLTPIVANARHIKAVPGRKTDVIDAEWIARLIRYALVRASFVPPRPIRDLREVTRYRRTLVEVAASERRRLLKLLESADMKLAEVLSDVFGVTGRDILRALIAGTATPAQMAALAKGHARKKIAPLTTALEGHLAEHQRFVLQMQLHRIEATEQQIAQLDEQIETRLDPYRAQMALLMSIPRDRVGRRGHHPGRDRRRYVGLPHRRPSRRLGRRVPGQQPKCRQAEGHRGPHRQPPRHHRPVQRRRQCRAPERQLPEGQIPQPQKPHRRAGKAVLAIGHKLLVCIWHMLAEGCLYRDLGESYLDRRTEQQTLKRYARKFNPLGYAIVPEQQAATMAA